MKGRKRVQYMILVAFLLSPLVIMPLSVPVLSNIVVVMHEDAATSAAVKTITESTPNVKVVQYNSLEYALIIQRVAGVVVWTSHGSEDGISKENDIIPWSSFSNLIELTPNRDIVLACHSARLYNYVSPESMVGVDGSIDAVLGGLLASYLLQPQDEIIHRVFERIDDLSVGRVNANLLDLSSTELLYWGATFLLSIMAYYTGSSLALSNPTWKQVMIHFITQNVGTNFYAIMMTVILIVMGQIDILVAVWQIIGFVIFDIPAAFAQMIIYPEIFSDPIFLSMVILGSAMIAASVFWGKLAFDLVALFVGFLFIFGAAVIDYTDNNDWVG